MRTIFPRAKVVDHWQFMPKVRPRRAYDGLLWIAETHPIEPIGFQSFPRVRCAKASERGAHARSRLEISPRRS